MDNIQLCAAAISKARDLCWSGPINPKATIRVGDVVIGENSFDPCFWSGQLHDIIPGKLTAALSLAIRESLTIREEALSLGVVTDWDAVAGRFLENLTPGQSAICVSAMRRAVRLIVPVATTKRTVDRPSQRFTSASTGSMTVRFAVHMGRMKWRWRGISAETLTTYDDGLQTPMHVAQSLTA
jgi:hypothetical protein